MVFMLICMRVKGAGMMKNKKRSSFWKMIVFELKFCFKNSPFLMIAEILASIFHGISFVVVIYFTQMFFDVIADAISQNKSFSDVFIWAILLGVVVILNQLINGFENWLYDVLYNKLKGYSYLNLYKKTFNMRAENFESPKFLDELSKAKEGAEQFILPLFPIIGISTFYLAYFVGIGWYIFNVYPVLIISIAIVFVPSIAGQFLKSFLFSKLADESAPYKRRYEYFEQCICGKDYFKETRLLSAGGFFFKFYKESLEILTTKAWKTNKKSAVIAIIVRGITLIGYLGVLLLFINALINGHISVGAFAAIYASIDKMFSMMDEVVDTISGLMQNIGLMQNYIEYLELPEVEKEKKPVSVNNKIELKDVTFKYKDAEQETLKHINLTVDAGSTIAVVGENGSGKSTLVKVMSGLFLPSSGKVLYDGADISEISKENVYDNISMVCQNFIKYKMNVRNNINISKNFDGSEDGNEVQDNEFYKLLENVDIYNNKDNVIKMDTVLAREFGGIDLSGGQWQRIAIARGMYRPHSMIILDEPTAAIDPVEEARIFNIFAQLTKDTTSIIVTHRMGCAKIADLILVMDKGEIVEFGTHEELLKTNGKYSEMYNSQLQWYQ